MAANNTSFEPVFDKIPMLAEKLKKARDERSLVPNLQALVVEDQLFSRTLLSAILRRKGFDVSSAETTREGFQLFINEAPDVTLLDIELPHDSGHALASFIKTIDPSAFVAMVSGNHSITDVKKARENEVNAFIAKPYSDMAIMDVLDEYFRLNPEKKSLAESKQSTSPAY